MKSALYVGSVRHRRARPRHVFEQRLAMLYLDLGELPNLFAGSWLYGIEKWRPASFWRRDHLGDPNSSLADAVRSLVQDQTGARPLGPVRLLTQLRSFGVVFNPLSLYFCFSADGETLAAIVADVTNTPWRERHAYVLPVVDPKRSAVRITTPKRFHVSPFLGMHASYRWRLAAPGARFRASLASWSERGCEFTAALALERRELDPAALLRAWLRFPFPAGQVVGGIYWQALRLWWKGAPFHPHPGRAEASEEWHRA